MAEMGPGTWERRLGWGEGLTGGENRPSLTDGVVVLLIVEHE